MPQTIIKTKHGQIIGGTFSHRADADRAVEALHNLGYALADIDVIARLNKKQAEEMTEMFLLDAGFSKSNAHYYDELVNKGQILVAVYGVLEPIPVIDIFDKFHAQYNPDGSRNLRDDVLCMTVGAAFGATALGALGTVVGGPVGTVVGAATGAIIGGGSGAAAGKAIEHSK